MDLYFSPLACSLATRIALYEAGAEARYLEVDPKTKIVQGEGSDFYQVNPLGLVPTLRTDEGLVAYLTLRLGGDSALADARARASEIEERIRRERPDIDDVIVHTEP